MKFSYEMIVRHSHLTLGFEIVTVTQIVTLNESSGSLFGSLLGHCSDHFLGHCLDHFLGHCLGHCLDHFLGHFVDH